MNENNENAVPENPHETDVITEEKKVGELLGSPTPMDSPDENFNPDTRLYVPDHQDWSVQIKRDSDRVYCYSKHPGEDWFHLILNGEIHVTRQHERYCLRCALRMGFLTTDRLFWQHRVPKKPKQVL